MMNKILYLVLTISLIACNNSKTEKTTEADSLETKENTKPSVNTPATNNSKDQVKNTISLIACNNSKTEKTTEADSLETKENTKPSVNTPATNNASTGAGSITFSIEDTVRNGTASI